MAMGLLWSRLPAFDMLQNRVVKTIGGLMNKKLLIIGAEPKSLTNFRWALIVEARNSGHDVSVAAAPASKEDLDLLSSIGVDFHPIPVSRDGFNPLHDIITFIRTLLLILRMGPNAVFCYAIKPVLFGTIAAWIARVPTRSAMVTGIGYAFTEGREKKRKVARLIATILYRAALPRATSVIFQNPDDAEEFKRLGFVRGIDSYGIVGGSGVDTNHFLQARLPEKVSFLMMARLVKDKGVLEFLAASRKLVEVNPEVSVWLLGKTDKSPHGIPEELIDKPENSAVKHLGWLADVRPAIEKASVVVLPSYREGTPRSVLEGMAMGRAIITTDVPGCRETVVHGRNGLLVPPRDPEALAAAMLELANDPQRVAQMGRESRRMVVEKYEAKAVALDTLRKAGIIA
jgi:glycosyltransferase involved in cell wall biosynthesis